MAEPIEMSFGVWIRVGPRKHVSLDRGAHWRILANTIEQSTCGGDATFFSNYFDHLYCTVSCLSARIVIIMAMAMYDSQHRDVAGGQLPDGGRVCERQRRHAAGVALLSTGAHDPRPTLLPRRSRRRHRPALRRRPSAVELHLLPGRLHRRDRRGRLRLDGVHRAAAVLEDRAPVADAALQRQPRSAAVCHGEDGRAAGRDAPWRLGDERDRCARRRLGTLQRLRQRRLRLH